MSETVKKMRCPELLSPAGNLEKLRTAILYGADAVYVGIPGLSLRGVSAEMPPEDLARGIEEAHAKNVRVYGALNTFARNSDLDRAKRLLPDLVTSGIDALIVSDPGMIRLIRQVAPQIPLHLSTQANTTNIEAVRFWQDQGICRIILARELNLEEIGKIAQAAPDMELEIFVHGAMCMSYSGRCFLSSWRNRRSANEGDCSQPCRWEYLLHESTRPDEPILLEEDKRYSYLLSSKDLCLIAYLREVQAAGVASIKIEGRMKSSYYVAVVTRTYRQALDDLNDPEPVNHRMAKWIEELQTISHRGYTTGFAFHTEKINETSPQIKYFQTHEPVGLVLKYNASQKQILMDTRNDLRVGEKLELLLPDKTVFVNTQILFDDRGNPVTKAHAGNQIYIPVPVAVPTGALLRKRKN